MCGFLRPCPTIWLARTLRTVLRSAKVNIFLSPLVRGSVGQERSAMTTEERLMEVAKLRLRFRMNNRLRLETLAMLSRVFREYQEPIADELLSSIVFAVPEELMGEGVPESTDSAPGQKPPFHPPNRPPSPPPTSLNPPPRPPHFPLNPPHRPPKSPKGGYGPAGSKKR